MFAIRLLVSPCRARCSPRSVGRSTLTTPLSTETFMSLVRAWVSSPLGPLTWTSAPLTSTLTPSGSSIGIFPIRDIYRPPPRLRLRGYRVATPTTWQPMSLPDIRDHLAADALVAGLVAGHDAG